MKLGGFDFHFFFRIDKFIDKVRKHLHVGVHFVRVASNHAEKSAKVVGLNPHTLQIRLVKENRFNHYNLITFLLTDLY